jgi:tetratricopeptide (TPR) repeat protein
LQNELLQQDRQDLIASEEWQKLLRHFEYNPGFAWIILLVRDSSFGRLCFEELQSTLQAKAGLNLSALPIAQPTDIETAVEKLLSIDPATSPLWIAGVGTPEDFRSAWERCAMKLNRTRDTIAARFPHALIFVMQPWTREVLRDAAPDFWSVRDTVVDLSFSRRKQESFSFGETQAIPKSEAPDEWSPDPDLALAQAARLRDKLGMESTLLGILDRAGRGLLQRGRIDKAKNVYEEALAIAQRLADNEPNRTDLQRDLAVALERMADLHQALGQIDQALSFTQLAFNIVQRLTSAEPNRFDLQRDLAFSFRKLGGLYQSLGQLDKALSSLLQAVSASEHLACAEPHRADLQRDLAVSFGRTGDIYQYLGQTNQALDAFQQALDIFQRLANAEPNRADRQRDLSFTLGRMGDVQKSLGQIDQALSFFQKDLNIAQSLASAEPNRSDLQRDLAISLGRMGDTYKSLGEIDQAFSFFKSALNLTQHLASVEPSKADFQHSLAFSLNELGDLYQSIGQIDEALSCYNRAFPITSRLASDEPNSAVRQRDLAVSYVKLSKVDPTNSAAHLQRALEIIQTLADQRRLNPTDAWMPAELQRRLAELP